MWVETEPARPPTLYFDNSALGRLTDPHPQQPITSQALQQILVDALDVERIVAAIRDVRCLLISSHVLEFELRQAPPGVQDIPLNVLRLAWRVIPIEPTVAQAELLQAHGFRRFDALHLAAAYTGRATYAVSCDERHWLRRGAQIAALLGPGPAIVSPAECVRREGW